MSIPIPALPAAWAHAMAPLLPAGWSATLAERLAHAPDVLPPRSSWLKAFDLAPERVKVLVLGQDPYHGPGQANGLAFSVNQGLALPPSLRNIIKQARSEGFDCQSATTGDLSAWHDQGVMLLNTCLTVSASKPGSHHGWGWELLTDAAVTVLSRAPGYRVFMLWGAPARSKRGLVCARHKILESPHPSPLSAYRGFLGNNHFTAANHFLESTGQTPIQW